MSAFFKMTLLKTTFLINEIKISLKDAVYGFKLDDKHVVDLYVEGRIQEIKEYQALKRKKILIEKIKKLTRVEISDVPKAKNKVKGVSIIMADGKRIEDISAIKRIILPNGIADVNAGSKEFASILNGYIIDEKVPKLFLASLFLVWGETELDDTIIINTIKSGCHKAPTVEHVKPLASYLAILRLAAELNQIGARDIKKGANGYMW
jgi:hypothetical protein